MTLPFILVEALTIVGVPLVISICFKLILDDTRKERMQREADLSNLRVEIERQFTKSNDELQKMAGEMQDFTQKVKRAGGRPPLVTPNRREFFSSSYGGTGTNQARLSSKIRRSSPSHDVSNGWRQ
jgi:hypothetical protein